MQITVSELFWRKLQIDPEGKATVRAGKKKATSRLVIKSDLAQPFKLSPDLARFLQVKNVRHLQIRYDSNENLLQIGPFIGILVNGLPNRSEYDPKSLQAELIYLSEIGRKMAAEIFIFTPACIDWSSQTTRGYVYKKVTNNNGIWVESRYPLPDVVYDRIPSRAIEARESYKLARRRLINTAGVQYFNRSFLNKWRVYKMLIVNEKLSPYLPETRLLNRINLMEMLETYKVLFIKPANGSLGKGIIKVRKNKNNNQINGFIGQQRIRRIQADDADDFLKKIKKITKNKSYIIQQGIDLIRYKKSTFDLRIIFQKNGQGKWMISKKFVRLAAPGSSITNLSGGGRIERSRIVLKNIFNANQEIIDAKNIEMLQLCEMIADTLETNSENIFGELGLDIGIDKNYHIWLIEVNSRPRKTTQSDMSQRIVYNTFHRPLEYAIYLAGYKNGKA